MRYNLGRCYLPEIFKELGVSNQDFADRMGISRQQASDTIRGNKKMGVPMLLSVCMTYEIDPMRIYELIPKPTQSS